MAGGRGKRKSTAALQDEAVKKANIIYNATANDALLANLMGTRIEKKDILDTSGDIDNKSVSDDFKKSLKNTARDLQRIYQPDTKMCNTCQSNPATGVITPEAGFDESRKSTATTCRECAMQDNTNVYIQNAAVCGHGMERYKRYLDCKECVVGRQNSSMVDYHCMIDVQCNDCGETYRKRERGKAVKEYKLCDNFINEVGLHCKLICQETKVVGDITMRCRNKRYTLPNGKINSKSCGARDKCKSLKKKGRVLKARASTLSDDDQWFVCLAVQDDRKTPESLPMSEETATVSSENDQDDRKMAAV
jgi:hypothetical protein